MARRKSIDRRIYVFHYILTHAYPSCPPSCSWLAPFYDFDGRDSCHGSGTTLVRRLHLTNCNSQENDCLSCPPSPMRSKGSRFVLRESLATVSTVHGVTPRKSFVPEILKIVQWIFVMMRTIHHLIPEEGDVQTRFRPTANPSLLITHSKLGGIRKSVCKYRR